VGVENDGIGAQLAAHRADERWWRCGQVLGEGRRSDGGGPTAGGGGKAGDCERSIRAEKKPRHGGEKSGRRRQHHFKRGAAWTQWRGVRGSWPTSGLARGGGLGSHRRGQLGRRGARERRRVTNERGPDGSGRARVREAQGARGLAGEGIGVGRAPMNNGDF
jgi:hypothetical protein